MSSRNGAADFKGPARQQGAVLYVALVMLIILALIGIVGMQVSVMQERMAANYRNVNIAFQAAERDARTVEDDIQDTLSAGGSYLADTENCSPTFDPSTWSDDAATSQTGARHTRRVDKCFPSSSLVMGRKANEETGNIYEVTALSADPSKTSSAVIDTIFVP